MIIKVTNLTLDLFVLKKNSIFLTIRRKWSNQVEFTCDTTSSGIKDTKPVHTIGNHKHATINDRIQSERDFN